MKKRILAAIITAVFALSLAAPAPALGAKNSDPSPRYRTPAGYNDNDYQKLVTFLELTDDDGVKNGTKINDDYDPTDPSTWNQGYSRGVYWTDTDEKEVRAVLGQELGLVGVLDVSGCSSIMHLDCARNSLTGLNVSDCSSLELLVCAHNSLAELDVSSNTSLEALECSYNSLTELDVSGNKDLQLFYCDYNSLTALDISCNAALQDLMCSGNLLTELDISNNTHLMYLFCDSNSLSEIDVSVNTGLLYLLCCDNLLTELDVSNNVSLQTLDCSHNALTELDVSNNTSLEILQCFGNALTELDISHNPALYVMTCYDNHLTELDLSSNPLLAYDSLNAEGEGYIGYYYMNFSQYGFVEGRFYARPVEGESFLGFFDQNGVLIAAGEWDDSFDCYTYYFQTEPGEGAIVARFTGGEVEPVVGDVDGDGATTISDALLALRAAMELIELTPEQTEAGDVNGDGAVTLSDALIILRTAMGLM